MFDFGDELTIESYRIPWLIWIQILVMLLLMVLLYGFTLSALDPSDCSSSSSTSLCPQSQLDQKPVLKQNKGLVSACFQASQVEENPSIKGEVATGITRRIVRGEDNVDKEGSSSLKEANQICFHPCHYLRLAKLAFLKCLGLDPSSPDNSSNSEQRKER